MRRTLFKTVLASALAWVGLLLILFNLPPLNIYIKLLFMSLAFCAVSTFLTLVIFSITAILSDRHVNRQYLFHVAMRRAFFLSFILIAAAILKLLNAATQGNIILLITAVVALEIYCTEYLK